MAQHFLLSAKARTLSLVTVARLSEEQARETFKSIRWHETQGNPVCPKCGCLDHYAITTRHLWKCKGCKYQFSVTSGTIFSSRKMMHRDILLAIAIFVNGAKGHSALQLSRDLDCQYKTAFVLSHKIREVLAEEMKDAKVSGHVEIDGCYVGGYVKPLNEKGKRVDRRKVDNKSDKRSSVIVAKERNGKSVTMIAKSEGASVQNLQKVLGIGSTVYADEATHWDVLHGKFDTKRINHSKAYKTDEACTNQAESFFSRVRRAEIGIHHHIAGPYLFSYAGELNWRENNCRISNGEQYSTVTSMTLRHPVSDQWCGYWQRNKAA